MSSVKKEARLSGMLLAKKGTALPAHTDHRLTLHAMDSFVHPNKESETCDQLDHSNLVEAVKEINAVTRRQSNHVFSEVESTVMPGLIQQVSNQASSVSPVYKKDVENAKNKDSEGKRVAMTLRMEQDDHLKLRLFSAHSRKSCQEIISCALNMYLSEEKKYVV